jgi:hypothetical protein
VSRFGKVRDKASPFDPSLRDYWEDRRNRRARGQASLKTFAFLGFTHIFGRTRERRRLIPPPVPETQESVALLNEIARVVWRPQGKTIGST